MDQVVQENAANANEAALASETLLPLSQELNSLISRIAKEVNADNSVKQKKKSQYLTEQETTSLLEEDEKKPTRLTNKSESLISS